MAKASGRRVVQCYLCRHRFEVSGRAQSTSCPGCHNPVIVEDFVLKKNKPSLMMVTNVQTCGRIVIPRRTRIVAKLVEAHGGIEVQGHLEADQVISGCGVVIADKSFWRGNLRAPTVVIQSKAVIEGGFFEVPDNSLGLLDLPETLDAPEGPVADTSPARGLKKPSTKKAVVRKASTKKAVARKSSAKKTSSTRRKKPLDG